MATTSYERETPSRYNELREMKFSRNKKRLVDTVAKMSKQLNQRYARLEKKGVADTSYGYQVSQKETGKNKPRYSISTAKLSKMNFDELYKLSLDINNKLRSKTTTIVGLQVAEQNRIRGAVNGLQARGIDINGEQLKAFLNRGGGEILSTKFIDSNQVIDDLVKITKNGNVSIEEFTQAFNEYKQKATDNGKPLNYTKLVRGLKKLSKERKKAK